MDTSLRSLTGQHVDWVCGWCVGVVKLSQRKCTLPDPHSPLSITELNGGKPGIEVASFPGFEERAWE